MPTSLFSKIEENGFTMIELMVVLVILSILATVVLVSLNPAHFRNIAENSKRQIRIKNIATGIAAHFASEGKLPEDLNSDGNPYNDSNGLSKYIAQWPRDAIYQYKVYEDIKYCVSVPMATDPAKYYKFVSDTIATNSLFCTATVVKDCTSSCLQDSDLNCNKITDEPCT